ncbi:MAG: HsdM family class I SAM-dependent methyltransferase, partial [Promethearchaeota archaeon]
MALVEGLEGWLALAGAEVSGESRFLSTFGASNSPAEAFREAAEDHEAALSRKVAPVAGQGLSLRRARGAVYTDGAVARYIVKRTIAHGGEGGGATGRLPRVLDPACGLGVFLREALELLAREYPGTPRERIAAECLFGVDVDPAAVELALANVVLGTRRVGGEVPPAPGNLEQHLFVGNALDLDLPPDGVGAGFDAVVGNPPYVLGDNLASGEKEVLRARFPGIYRGEADYSFYFVKRGLDLLREGGRLGFILPAYILKAHYGRELREHILGTCKVSEVVDFGNVDVFAGVGSRCCVLVLEKAHEVPFDHQVRVVRVTARSWNSGVGNLLAAVERVRESLGGRPTAATPGIEGFLAPQSGLSGAPWVLLEPGLGRVLAAALGRYPSFKERGVRVGRGGITGHSVFVLAASEFRDLGLEPGAWKPNLKNSEIRAYHIRSSGSRVLHLGGATTFAALERFPKTRRYLLDHLDELAFGRREFTPPCSRMVDQGVRKEVVAELKGIGLEPSRSRAVSLCSRELLANLASFPFARVAGDEVVLDVDSPAFHDAWQWWRWTSPRNLDLFGTGSPAIVSPYIAPENRFALAPEGAFNATGDILGVGAGPELPVDPRCVLALLNSRLYDFMYRSRAKRKDYRYEYYPTPLLELPLPSRADFGSVGVEEGELARLADRAVELRAARRDLEAAVDSAVDSAVAALVGSAVHPAGRRPSGGTPFGEYVHPASPLGLELTVELDGDPRVDSVALKVERSGALLRVLAFFRPKLEWTVLATVRGPDAQLECLYALFDHFTRHFQVPSRRAWRSGKLASEVLERNVVLPVPPEFCGEILAALGGVSGPRPGGGAGTVGRTLSGLDSEISA